MANSRQNIRKLVKDGFIIRKPTKMKGNVFESIHKSKAEKAREKTLSDQFEAKRAKNKASRERKHARREALFLEFIYAISCF
ncbi:hypothetical protein Lal_00046079 [Lupinus albus]|nr:hypothetical protein Lal_00046079 [Lupinus albus]